MAYWVYIMASARYGYLYVGITNNLVRRAFEHRQNLSDGYTKTHVCHHLVYYVAFDTATAAITREKQLKRYTRAWKFNLVDTFNPLWQDLYPTICR